MTEYRAAYSNGNPLGRIFPDRVEGAIANARVLGTRVQQREDGGEWVDVDLGTPFVTAADLDIISRSLVPQPRVSGVDS